jgi:hypothetical protein
MTEKRIALFVISISSILVWDVLTKMGIVGGKLQTILIVLSLVPFVYSSFLLLNDHNFESSYFKFIFSLFFCYQLIIIIRGWSFSYEDIKTFMQAPYVFWPFIIPLFIFFNKKIETFGFLLKWIYYSGVFFLIIAFIFPILLLRRLTAETYINLFIPCGFLLLNATYLRNRKVNLSFIVLLISIISLTYLARRSGLGTLLGFVISAYFLNLINKSESKLFRYFPLIVIIVVFVLFSQYFENSKEVLFNKMALRLSEDTRSGVFERFFYSLKDNMVFGTGMNGTYYCPLWDAEVDGVSFGAIEYRNIIENGYLQLLLTGGVIHIVLFVLVLLPAALKGIFMSSNQFLRACGIVILLRLIDMFFYGLPSLTLSYILVWICVGVCYKTSLRRMSNEEISNEFKKIGLL